jgi:hypothetical protein
VTSDIDLDQLRWYTRESFENLATSHNVEIIEYSETELDTKGIPAKTRQLYPEAKWIRFDAVAKYSDEVQELLDSYRGVVH